MTRRIFTLLITLIVVASCGGNTVDGGSRTDFVRCQSTRQCPEGACIEGRCDPTVTPTQQGARLSGQPCTSNADCGDISCDIDSGYCRADCRDPARSCRSPLVCTEEEGVYRCIDPSDPPACRGTPEGQAVPFQTTHENGDGPTLHWGTDDACIPVTYSSSVADMVGLIEQAIAAWDQVACAQPCLSSPTELNVPPDPNVGESRVHFTTAPRSAFPDGQEDLVTLTYLAATGIFLNAEVEFADERAVRSRMTIDDVLKQIGTVLGLGTAKGEESVTGVVFEPNTNEYDAPTDLDIEALCTLYGADPYCSQ